MPRLSEHDQSGEIGMLQAGVRVSDVARYYDCHPSTLHGVRDRYQATVTAKDRRRSDYPTSVWQLTSIASTILASTISVPTGYCQCQTNSGALRVICFRFFDKNILL